MFFSFRSKLFAISLALLMVFVIAAGAYLHQTLRGWTESRITSDLHDRAALIVSMVDTSGSDTEVEAMIGSLENVGEQRVTLVDVDGSVLVDTGLSNRETETVEDHADRPEIRAAREGGMGMAHRHSTTVDDEMLYVALLTDRDQIVRVALPLREVDEVLAHLRLLLIIGILFGIGAAVLMSSIASKLMSRSLQIVLDRARENEPENRRDPSLSPTDGDGRSLNAVTQRLEETLEQLARQRNRFRAILNGMSEGVVATDGDLQITQHNRAVQQLLRIDDEAQGTELSQWVPQEIVSEIADSAEGSAEFEVTTPRRRCIQVRAAPRPDSEGVIFVFHDVTTIRHLETMRRDFVANVSHELRTPVTIIQANAETMLDGAIHDLESAEFFTEGIHRNAERLSRLIADLLDLSRIEAGEIEFNPEPLVLSTVVAQAIDDLGSYADSESVQVACAIDRDIEVIADRDALQQVLLNLLENALKYIGDGGQVEIRARHQDAMIGVEVEDDGAGIGAAHRDRIFERFYRVDQGRSSDMGGTGLGLSIVKHLVSSMGGTVGYRAADSGGSIFWFTLPTGGDG